MHPVDTSRLSRLKPSFATRRVRADDIRVLDTQARDLASGDVVIARVEEIGHHTKIERPDGRRAKLFVGDEVLLACAARYAPDQFEADCPVAIGPANLAAAGGIAGIVRHSHNRMAPATKITVLGAARTAEGHRVNLADYAISSPEKSATVPMIAVCGTSMNSGKTHTVASLVHGLSRDGHKVAAIKVTGTGAGGDLWFFRDSGAHHVSDFTDAGFASTYRVSVTDILAATRRLIAYAEAAGSECIVIEIADGLRQEETAAILRSEEFREMLDGIVFAAGDALGAESGVAWLADARHRVLAISGCLTKSPLAIREVATSIDLPCLTPEDLYKPGIFARLLSCETPLMRAA